MNDAGTPFGFGISCSSNRVVLVACVLLLLLAEAVGFIMLDYLMWRGSRPRLSFLRIFFFAVVLVGFIARVKRRSGVVVCVLFACCLRVYNSFLKPRYIILWYGFYVAATSSREISLENRENSHSEAKHQLIRKM